MNAELLEWLHTQLDEDERVANELDELDSTVRNGIESTAGYGALQLVDRFDRERLLRQVEATRKILAPLEGVLYQVQRKEEVISEEWDAGEPTDRTTSDALLKLLALWYADCPGYREEWRP